MKNKLVRGPSGSHKSLQLVAGATALLGLLVSGGAQMTTTLASVAWDGTQWNGDSPVVGANISANGRYVAFGSVASNLVPGDTNGSGDVFVRDLWTGGTTTRVSIGDDESQAIGAGNPSISADGRYVAFGSADGNLVPGDTNGIKDVFVRDTVLETTTLVSVGLAGTLENVGSDSSAIGLSADGMTLSVVFRSTDMSGTTGSEVFVRALTRDPFTGSITGAGTTTLVSVDPGGMEGNGDSGFTQTTISADGRYVGFSSTATNLIGAGNDTNGKYDVFVRDLSSSTTMRVSVTNAGLQGNIASWSGTLSGNGRYVAFSSSSTNLVAGDSNRTNDVFVRDIVAGTTTRVSLISSGQQGNGRSGGSNNGWGMCGISADGRYIAFQSDANNLIGSGKDKNNVQDVFVRDRALGTTTMASVTPANKPANGASSGPSMSADGLSVMFCSYATNLVTGDTNGFMDVFVRK